MKKVLYITNIEVPYKITFFNEMSKYCDLFVLYENKLAKDRDIAWTKSVNGNYKHEYLDESKCFINMMAKIYKLIRQRI